MGAFNRFSSEQYHEDSKYENYDTAQLDGLTQNTPSPNGAASQGALGTLPPGGETSPALGDEGKGAGEARKPISDFHRMHMEATPEEQDAVADKMEEQFADQGLSLQGAVNQLFEQGGETAMRAAEQFGYTPPEGKGGKEAFKTREQALSDYNVDMDMAVERGAVETKRQNNRRAMGGFLMDIGLRILASNREGVSAVGEGALGAIESRRERKQQGEKDTIAAEDRKRRISREDASDEAGKVEASARKTERAAKEEEREYQKTQRAAAEAKGVRAGMQEVTNDKGEVYYFDPLNPEKGKYVTDKDGNRVKSKDVGLTPAQVEITGRAYKAARAKARTAIEKDIKDYDTQYPQIAEETDSTKKKALIDAAVDEILVRDGYDQSGNSVENYSELDW